MKTPVANTTVSAFPFRQLGFYCRHTLTVVKGNVCQQHYGIPAQQMHVNLKKKLLTSLSARTFSRFHKSDAFSLSKSALINVLIYSSKVASLSFAFRSVDSTLPIIFTAAQTKQEVLKHSNICAFLPLSSVKTLLPQQVRNSRTVSQTVPAGKKRGGGRFTYKTF